MRGDDLIRLAKEKPVIGDGAMGTMLQRSGMQSGECPELWNVSHPDVLRRIHQEYIDAGSQVIGTNTFGGNRLKLESYGLSDRLVELNSAGVAIAREMAGPNRFVAASIGPTGKFLEPLGELSFDKAVDVFAEQAFAQAKAGADVILLETFSDLDEARAAVTGVLKSGVPCFCTMTFDTGGRTMMGIDPITAATSLVEAGASGVGANCGLGPAGTLEIIRSIRNATDAIVIAQPNAGLPVVVDGQTTYNSTPEEMAHFAVEFAAIGVNIIGACCGSSPDHIRAMAEAVKAL